MLALVFLDEVLAAVSAGVWGHHAGGPLLAGLLLVVVIAVWWTFASPKAPVRGRGVRPLTKVLVFGAASLGLWAAGHRSWGVALLVFSAAVNAAAQLPSVRGLVADGGPGPDGAPKPDGSPHAAGPPAVP